MSFNTSTTTNSQAKWILREQNKDGVFRDYLKLNRFSKNPVFEIHSLGKGSYELDVRDLLLFFLYK